VQYVKLGYEKYGMQADLEVIKEWLIPINRKDRYPAD